jgi:RNA polymerase sigma-70 factor (ECF subfamily)
LGENQSAGRVSDTVNGLARRIGEIPRRRIPMSWSIDFELSSNSEQYTDILVSSCVRRFGCDVQAAEDAAQHALAKAWEKRDQFRGESEGELRKWLLKTAHHYLVSNFRIWNRMKKLAPDEWAAQATVSDDRELVDGKLDLPVAMNKLRLELRETLELHRYKGHTMAQIADRLNISLTTVYNRIHRALRELRESME